MDQSDVQHFKIDPDDPFIFSVLRKSMYSNPLRTAIQEYFSNSRDSHRETNRTNIPVEFIINTRDNYFVVKDYGPGISEDRMSEVFLWYGRSTKRGDNRQTGGFGLGGKLGMALSDSFLVTTRVDGFQYEYCIYIDETSKGALKLLHKRPLTNDEKTGTEVRIPVPNGQTHQVEAYVREIGQWCNPTPVILGKPVIPHVKPLFSGNGWVILDPKDLNRMDRKPLCICDGIPFYGNIPTAFNINVPYSVIPVFKTGEIQLPANRENVHWCDLTANAFKQHIENFYNEYKVHLEKDLNDLNTWEDKLLYMHKVIDIFKDEKILKDLKYKDQIKFKTPDNYYDKTQNLYEFTYKPWHYEEKIHINYSVPATVAVNAYYDYANISGSNKKNLAEYLKTKNAFVIYNDLIEETAKEMVENLKTFEKKWGLYESRLKDYNEQKRKSRPSKPSNLQYTPIAGVATKDIQTKLYKYIKDNKITQNVFIVSAPFDDIPIKYDAKLSDVKNMEIVKPEKIKNVKPTIPSTVQFYQGYYKNTYIKDLGVSKQLLYMKFATKNSLMRAKSNNKKAFDNVKDYLSLLNLDFIIITDLEFKNLEKYQTGHNVKINMINFDDFIGEFIKQNPGLKESNHQDYNLAISKSLSDNIKKILCTHGKAEVKQKIEQIKPIKHSTELVWGSEKVQFTAHTSLLNYLVFLKHYNKNLKDELDKLKPIEYNIDRVQREIDGIKNYYPLLKHVYVSANNEKECIQYVKLMNTI